jgi:hypothetical protein
VDIRDSKTASVIIEDIESNQTQLRRIAEYKAYKVECGAQREYVIERLSQLFPESYKTMRVSDISLSRKVISKISKAYKDKPIRDAGDSTDVLGEVYTAGMFNRAFKEFERDYNRQSYGLLWINRVNDNVCLHSLKGFEAFVVRYQGSGELKCVIINYPDTEITTTTSSDTDFMDNIIAESQNDSSANSRIYAMWTKEHHSVWRTRVSKDAKGNAVQELVGVPISDNMDMINPLGVLPFVFASKSTAIDLPFINPITEQSIMYNLLQSDLLTAAALQGYGQLVLKMPEGTEMKNLHTGMTTAINLPLVENADNQADASYINANPDLDGMRETIKEFAQQVLSEHGITAGQASGEFSSGLERLIANADVTDLVDSNQQQFAEIEKQVFEVVKRYGEVYGDFSLGNDELKVVFPKSKVLISDAETLQNIKTRMELGLITEVEAMQIIDPNLGDDQAREKLEEIKREKQNKISTFMGGINANIRNGSQQNDQPQEEVEQDS